MPVVLKYTGTVDGKGVWIQTGTGNTGSAKFAEVKGGTVVPITTGTSVAATATASPGLAV